MPELHQRFDSRWLRSLKERTERQNASWYTQPTHQFVAAPFRGYFPTRCAIVLEVGYGENQPRIVWQGTRNLPWKWNSNKMPKLFAEVVASIVTSTGQSAALDFFEYDTQTMLRFIRLAPTCSRYWTNRNAMSLYYPTDVWAGSGYSAEWTDNPRGDCGLLPVKVVGRKYHPIVRNEHWRAQENGVVRQLSVLGEILPDDW